MGEKRAEGEHLVQRAAGYLADQVTDSAYQAAPDQTQPHQQQALTRGVASHNQHAKQPVDLAGPATGQAVRPESSAAHLTMGDLSTWRRDHAVAAEVRTPAELDAVPEHRQRRVKAT